MDDLESKMGAILGNPELMQKIMAMAQSLNPPEQKQEAQSPQKQSPENRQKSDNPGFSVPDIDLSMLQKLSGFAQHSRIDKNQQKLLTALNPYLRSERISKLEKAMQAAKLASMASSFLGQSGLQTLFGR